MTTSNHHFGGEHTKKKLDILEYYSTCYSIALNRYFKCVYIDAFAGTGEIITSSNEEIIGSAKLIIENENLPFKHLHFIEEDRKRYRELRKLTDSSEKTKARTHCGDANTEIPEIIKAYPANTRFLIFLVPYGLHIKYEMLREISGAKLDILMLFNARGVERVAPIERSSLTNERRNKLFEFFGSDIENQLYTTEQSNLFDEQATLTRERKLSDKLSKLYRKKLEDNFSLVKTIAKFQGRGTEFSLFLILSNESKSARNLASKFLREIRKNLVK